MARRRSERRADVAERGEVPVWYTACPSRNPTHVLRGDYDNRLVIVSFCAVFAAKKAFEILTAGETYKWLNTKTVVTSGGMKITSEQLEEIVEYDFSKTEQEWDFPPSDTRNSLISARNRQATAEERIERNERLGIEAPRESVKREKKEHVPKPSRDGLITVQAIAQELNIEAGEARAILRKAKVEKPEAGWAFNDNEAKSIRDIIKKGMK